MILELLLTVVAVSSGEYLIQFEGKSFDVRNDQRVQVFSVDTTDTVREYLIKLKYPTVITMDDIGNTAAHYSATTNPFLTVWAKPAAKNTIVSLCSGKAANELASLPGVVWVGMASDEHKKYLKIHGTILEPNQHPLQSTDTSKLVITPHESVDEVLKVIPSQLSVQISGRRIIISCLETDCQELATSLSSHDGLIEGVEHPLFQYAKNKFARGLMQCGDWKAEPFEELSGSGHVVGVTDTGIDHDHCFFRDDEVRTPIDVINPRHRKIVAYYTADKSVGGQSDFEPAGDGHGTHVAGSVAGSKQGDDESPFHGLLRHAKLAFIDIAAGGGGGDGVQPPYDLTAGVFRKGKGAGAHIHTNSWGSYGGSYGSQCRDIDSYSNDQPSDLIFFAAGNEADKACKGNPLSQYCDKGSVITPCIAKNSVCVGASMAPLASWMEMGLDNYYINFTAPNMTQVTFMLTKGFFGERHPKLWKDVPLAMAQPEDACSAASTPGQGKLDNPQEIKGKVAIVKRGTCYFETKVKLLENAGAIGIIVVNNIPGDPIVMGAESVPRSDFVAPGFMMSDIGGELLIASLASSPTADIYVDDQLFNTHKSPGDLAEFSSRGPSRDYRFKPDVVGVGYYVHSARSDSNLNTNNCDIIPEMGTSMATPIVASTAVQIRQWLLSKSIKPTGVLLKAMLIQSALPLSGLVDRNAQGDWLRLGQTPDFYQGHGRVQLNTTLASPSDLGYVFEKEFTKSGEVHEMCFKQSANTQFTQYGFRVTLAWMDAPIGGQAEHQLVNDLDLEVQTPSGEIYLGNAHGTPNNHVRDVLNNVEKVISPSTPGGIFRVTVKATSVLKQQGYAVVGSGQLVDCEGPKPPCTSGSACGTSESLSNAINGNLYTGSEVLKVLGWRLFKVTITKDMTQLRVDVKKTGTGLEMEANPDIYIRKSGVPNLIQYDKHSNNKCGSEPQCAAQTTRALQLDTTNDKEATYYIGIFMRCCRDAHVEVTIGYDTIQDNPPVISSIAVGSLSVTNSVGKHMTISTSVYFKGAKLVIEGSRFGTSTQSRLVSLNALPYNSTQDDASYVILCKVDDLLSTSTILHCSLPAGYAPIKNSPISVTVDGVTTVSLAAVSFDAVDKSRYRFFNIQACDSSVNCLTTRETMYYDNHLSQKGGDLFIRGSNFGDRDMEGNNAILIQIGNPEDGWRTCVRHPYISENIVMCNTPPGMSGSKQIKSSIFGIELGVLDALLFFEPAPTVTGISKTADGKPVQTLLLGYYEAIGSTIWIHGKYLGNIKDDNVIYGSSEENGFGDGELKITLGTQPNFNNIICSVKPSTTDRSKVACTLPADIEDSLRDKLLNFRIRKYETDMFIETSLMVLNPPMITGISTSTLLKGASHLVLPHTVLSTDRAPKQLIIWGENFPSDEKFSCTFADPETENVIGISPLRYQSDEMLEVDFIIWKEVPETESLEVLLKISRSGTLVDSVHNITITVAPKPHISKVTVEKNTPTLLGLTIEGYISMQTEPFVTVGDFACLVKDQDLHHDHLYCEGVPINYGVLPVKVYFSGALASVDGDAKLEVEVLKGGPIELWTKSVTLSNSILIEEQSLSIPPTEGVDHFAITTHGCGLVNLYQSDTTHFNPSISVTADKGLNYTVCWGTESHKDLWFPTTPGVVQHVSLSEISLHSSTYWSHPVEYNTPTSHVKLGHLPEEQQLTFSISGANLPPDSLINLIPGTDGCKRSPLAVFKSQKSSTKNVTYSGTIGTAIFKEYGLCLQINTANDYFLGTVTVVACKVGDTEACNKHGSCIEGSCQCYSKYKGFKCELECPLNSKTSEPCSNSGICTDDAECSCFPQIYGSTCDIKGKETEIQKKYVGEVSKSSWELYHLKPTHKGTFLDIEWFSRQGMFDVLIWDKASEVGLPEKVTSHFVMSEPFAKDKALHITLKLSAEGQEKDVYIGIYGSLVGSDDSLSFDLYITDGTPLSEEVTPAPLVNRFNDFTHDYEWVAAVAGSALGILLVCCVCLLWKYVCGPFYSVFLARKPVALEDQDDLDDFDNHNDIAVHSGGVRELVIMDDDDEERT